MRAPEFWKHRKYTHALAPALTLLWSPCGWVYGQAVEIKQQLSGQPWTCPAPIICVGNLTVGGAGKTPVALGIMQRLQSFGLNAHFLTRGYGGKLTGPVQVDSNLHTYQDVGDEALILAQTAPTWVSPDRVKGAQSAFENGAQAIVMDDGFQNPSLYKNLSVIVIDGAYGFGNGHVMPAGPLRQPLKPGLDRSDVFMIIGDDQFNVSKILNKPILKASVHKNNWSEIFAQRPVIAFAGIGRPQKFFDAIKNQGGDLIESHAFADHFPYDNRHLEPIINSAKSKNAVIVTTEKDMVRIPENLKHEVKALTISLDWRDRTALDQKLMQAINGSSQ